MLTFFSPHQQKTQTAKNIRHIFFASILIFFVCTYIFIAYLAPFLYFSFSTMPKKKIDISQCNAEDLRFKPFNLLWGGPLLVEDRKLQKKRLAKQAKANQIAAQEAAEAAGAAEAQPEVQPEVKTEVQPEAQAQPEAPPEEPAPSAEAVETPAAAAETEPAVAEPKEEEKAEEAKEDMMEKKKSKKKRHGRKKSRHVDDYDYDYDYDYYTDTDSSGSSLFRHERRSTHGHHRSKCCCKHDEKTDKHKDAGKKKSAYSVRCPVCRQHVSISSSDDDTSADERKSKRSHGSKRSKKKRSSGKEYKKKEKGGGGGDGKDANEEGDKKDDKKDEKEAAPAAAEEKKTEAETPADAAAAEPDNNVLPTSQDVVPPLPAGSVSGAGNHRADLSDALFDYPPSMAMPGFPSGFHETLAYRSGPPYPPYPYPYPVPYPPFGFPYPPFPPYPYGSPPPVMPPPVPFMPPHMNMMPPPPPPPMVPYPPPGEAYTDVDTYEHKSTVKTVSEGGMADCVPAWHDVMTSGVGVDHEAKGAVDDDDEWGIHWKPPVQQDGTDDIKNWGIDPCGIPESSGHDHVGTAWTSDDMAVLERLHEERITDQWRDLQSAFYNATGRVVDLEVLKSKIEQGIDKQESEHQDFGNQYFGNQGGASW